MLPAPHAREGLAPLSLDQIYSALPRVLHAATARGFFGCASAKWRVGASSAAVYASMHTLQLLPWQPGVTAVHVTVSNLSTSTLQDLIDSLALTTHLTAVYFQRRDGYLTPAPWLQQLAPLTGLQRLEVRGCGMSSRSLVDAMVTLTKMQLTALVLEGAHLDWCLYDIGSKEDAEMKQVAFALLSLTALAQLGLPGIVLGRSGMQGLGATLAVLPHLRSLDLHGTASSAHVADPMLTGVAGCTALTKLDLSCCGLSAKVDIARALRGVRLHSLTLDQNYALGIADVRNVLAVPALLGLTCLSLTEISLHPGGAHGHRALWPWRHVCALTALQELELGGSNFRDEGSAALALYVCALVQLRRLDIACCGLTVAGALAQQLWQLPRLQQLACRQLLSMEEPFVVAAAAHAPGNEIVRHLERPCHS